MNTRLYEASGRGLIKIDWLTGHYVFSFGEFYDSKRMGVGPLLVLNDDYIAPMTGFPAHPHRDMEIVTVALQGELHHRDSTGGVGVLKNGSVQIMSAGTGIVHSEYNGGQKEHTHSLQVWIRPRHRGSGPKYRDYHLGVPALGEYQIIVAPESERALDADVVIARAKLDSDHPVILPKVSSEYSYFIYVIQGELKGDEFCERDLMAGDAILVRELAPLELKLCALAPSEILVFRLNESD